MALNVEKGTVTIDVTGQKTISLPSNFDPKVIIMWGSTRAATGTSIAANRNSFGFGWGTYRGSSVSQSARAMFAEPSDPGSSSGDRMSSNTALFILITSTPGIDCEVDLVSMQGGATSEVVIDVVNLDSTADIIIHYLILGGSDLEDAEVVNSTTSTTSPQDISGSAGFGQPDLIGVLGSVTTGGASGNPMMSIGWGIKDGAQCVHHWLSDDAAAVSLGFLQKTGAIYAGSTVPPVQDAEAALAASSGWPTDGVELTWSDPAPNATNHLSLLFLKGTFSKAIGTGTNEEVGSPPVNQDHAVGFTVKGVITHTGGIAASASYQTATPNGPSFTVGASDGTNHGQSTWIDDDGDNNQRLRHRLSTNRVIEMLTNSGGTVTLQADATADFSVADTLRFAWQTLDGTARQFLYVALGDAVSEGAFEINAEPGSYAVSGVAASPVAGRMVNAAPGSYAVSGVAASVPAGRMINAAPGSYAVSGAAAGVIADHLLNAEAGSYAIAGAQAGLAKGYFLAADPGSYDVLGLAASLIVGRAVNAEPGAYTVTGAEAGTLADRVLAALAGTYTIDGISAELVLETPGAYALNAEPGSYALAGVDAALVTARLLVAEPGSYALVGNAAGLLAERTLVAEPGAYSLDGVAATLALARAIIAEPGSYTILGAVAQLIGSNIVGPPVTSRTGTTLAGSRTGGGAGSGRTRAGITEGGSSA